VTDAALLRSVGSTPGAEGSSVQAMFEILDTRVLVISASVGAVRRWSILYQAFRARPGPADITVVVGSCGDAEQPRSGEAAVIVGDVVVPWTGAEPLFPPLWAPPLDRWVYLRGTAVGRAGQAVVLLSRADAQRRLLALAMVARGAWLLADEVVPLDPGDLLVAPFPKALRLGREALGMLGIDLGHPALTPFRTRDGGVKWLANPETLLRTRSARVAADAGAIVVVEPADPEDEPRLEPLAPRDALRRLAGQLRRVPEDFQTGMEALVRLCGRTPAYQFWPGSPTSGASLLDETLLA
jgi:hypothetical protein